MTRVLIVDDSRVIRKILKDELEALGYTVAAEAGGGEEAVQAFLRLRPDLVLMDIALEGIDGLESVRRIRSTAPDARVIVVSALPAESVREQAQGLRLDGILSKPFTPDDLKHALEAGHG